MGIIGLVVGGILDANKASKQKKAQNNDSVETVVVKDKFSIDIPSFLKPTNKLSADAELQYWSVTLDIQYQVTAESKAEFEKAVAETKEEIPSFGEGNTLLDKMAVVTIANMFDIDKTEIGEYRERTINGLKAITLNAFQKRTFLKDALYGSFAFIEGRDTLYQIIILTGGTSISKLADKLEASIMSFKEL